jgi:hypothetical protein
MKSHVLLFFTLYLVDSIQLRWNLRECLSASSAERVCGGKREGPTLFNYINNSPAVPSGENIPQSAGGAQKLKSERSRANESGRARRFISGNKTLMMHAAVFARGPDQSC